MGQGSRGGNSGVSSSGTRQRNDKEAKRAAEKPIIINNRNSNQNSAQGGKGGRGRRGGLLRGFGNGLGGFGLPNLGGGGKSGGGSGSGGTTPPPGPTQQNKIPTISRIKPTKVKLAKTPKNKVPN
jgi:hypothetical protein